MARRPRTPNAALAGTPNAALAAPTRSGGIGNARLARRVNAAGRELGLRPHYDKTSVSHRLAGSVLKPEARTAATEALSRLLGRPLTGAEIDWPMEEKPGGERDIAATAAPDRVSRSQAGARGRGSAASGRPGGSDSGARDS